VLPTALKTHLESYFETTGISASPNIIQIQIEVPKFQFLPYLKTAFCSPGRQFYFSRADSDFSMAAVGSILELNFSGKTRFDEGERFFNHWKKLTTAISKDGFVEAAEQMFLVQSTFSPEIQSKQWEGFSPLRLYIPQYLFTAEGNETQLFINQLFYPDSTTHSIERSFDEMYAKALQQIEFVQNQPETYTPLPIESTQPAPANAWKSLVTTSVRQIKQDALEKVVLSTQLPVKSSGEFDVYGITKRLEADYPNCTTFLVRNEKGQTFLGATPEEFALIKDGRLHCDALAGSIQRGESKYEDEQFGRELFESTKDRSEHQYVVEFLSRTLQPLVSHLSYPHEPSLLKLQNVQHLYTPFEGKLKKNISLFKVIEQLHPTPAVGGIHAQSAMEFIAKHENYMRGCYAAPLGTLTTGGAMDLVVGLRSGLFDGNRATLFAGAGIVKDSDPDTEYDEIMMKFQPLLNAIQPQDFHAESLQS